MGQGWRGGRCGRCEGRGLRTSLSVIRGGVVVQLAQTYMSLIYRMRLWLSRPDVVIQEMVTSLAVPPHRGASHDAPRVVQWAGLSCIEVQVVQEGM